MFAQNEINLSDVISQILEDAAEQDDDEARYSLAQITSEYLENLASSKINLNTATWSDLETLPFLTDVEIQAILDYRINFQQFYSINELKGIKELTAQDIKFLSCFVFVGKNNDNEKFKLKDVFLDGRNILTTTLKTGFEKQKAYKTDSNGIAKFPGLPQHFCVKYKYRYKNNFAFGFTAENDPGEQIEFTNKRYGFDFNSAYLKIQNVGHLNKLIIGDYIIKFGQGLILGGGFSVGKCEASAGSASSGCNLREYSSTNENWFYRGFASSIKFKSLTITSFASFNKIDANLNNDSLTFYSLRTNGYHRTDKEIDSKDNISQYVGGIISTYHIKKFQLGIAVVGYKFDKLFVPNNDLRYAFTRSEKENYCFSTTYHYGSSKLSFYGETALDKETNLATINTLEIRPSAYLKFMSMYRFYSKKYLAFNANSIGENSSVNNEEGIYLGAELFLGKKTSITSWIDMFKNPWATYSSNTNSNGTEISTEINHKITKTISTSLRWKYKEKITNKETSDLTEKQYIRFQFKYNPTGSTTLTTVGQWSDYKKSDNQEDGYLIYQNITYKPQNLPLTMAARYARFSTPYNARIYAYENDVLYFFSVPGYYYEGSRYYIVLGWNINSNIKLQTRFSQWIYSDRDKISSGDSEIDGNKKTELNVYFQINF